jgi:hypothetical protein
MALFKGNGIIWDSQGDAILCTFKNGEFETSDLVTINKLKALGYEDLGNKEEVEQKIQELEETATELKTGKKKKK